jgi:hypothetical protein
MTIQLDIAGTALAGKVAVLPAEMQRIDGQLPG